MSEAAYRVLFICTGNSARSIMAEGLLNAVGKGRFEAHSAGSHPAGTVNPLALAALDEFKIPATGFRSKSWDEFSGAGAPAFDFVFTLCDKAAGEVCAAWPNRPITAHWGIDDPAAVKGGDAEQRRAFRAAATILKRRIDLLLMLPIARLDALSLQRELRQIGQVQAAAPRQP